MNVTILTEGGRDIGFGHLTRCIALKQAIEGRIGNLRICLMVNGDSTAKSFLKRQGVDPIIINWIERDERLLPIMKRSDIVLIDSYLAPTHFYSMLKEERQGSAPYLVAIDDYNRLDYDVDMVINPSIWKHKLPHDRTVSKKKYLLGRDYIILRKEFWNVPKRRTKKNIENVLITFGGKDMSGFVRRLIKFLSIRFPNLSYHLLIADPRNLPGIKPALFGGGNLKLYSRLSTSKIRSLMMRCDLSISGGGQTLYELARCGLPTIGISFARNQLLSLKGFNRLGFLKYAGWYNAKEIFDEINRGIIFFSSQKNRKSSSDIGRRSVNGKGVANLVRVLLKNVEKVREKIILRRANMNDCYDIWRWRNDLRIRRNSFNQEKIAYKEHMAWFKDRIEGNNMRIYIGENKRQEKIGQARFEFNGTKRKAYINVNLNPQFFGMGLGNRLISLATESFTRENTGVRKIFAEIIDENLASKKAFAKAGYLFFHRAYKDGKRITVFKYSPEWAR